MIDQQNKESVVQAAEGSDINEEIIEAISTSDSFGVDLSAAAAGIELNSIPQEISADETIVAQVYMNVEVQEVTTDDTGTITLAMDIKPMYQIVIIDNSAAGEETPIGIPTELEYTEPVTMEIPVGNAFEGITVSTVYVKHTKEDNTEYVYEAEYDSETKIVRFVNEHGFSSFEISTTDSAEAYIGTTGYMTFQEAIDAAGNNDTIKVVTQKAVTASISRPLVITIENDKNVSINPAEGYHLSKDNNVYTVERRGELVHIDAADPGCETSGNIEYWMDSVTGIYFSDEQRTNILNEESVFVPATGHNYSSVSWEWSRVPGNEPEAFVVLTCSHDSSHIKRVQANVSGPEEEYDYTDDEGNDYYVSYYSADIDLYELGYYSDRKREDEIPVISIPVENITLDRTEMTLRLLFLILQPAMSSLFCQE